MKILKQLNLDDVLFFDIETVNQVKQLNEGTPLWHSWMYKNKYGREPLNAEDPIKSYDENAALFPEYAKIACITIGKIKDGVLKLKSYCGEDESALLKNFCKALTDICAANKKTLLSGWAIKGFDLPWIVRRCIVNQIDIPNIIDTGDKKPWEIPHVDLMEFWKGSAFNGTSLIAAAIALGLADPKDELHGYQTTTTYYNDPDGLAKIAAYCEKDVLCVANILLKCRQEPIIKAEVGDIKVKQVGVLNRAFNSGELSAADEKEIVKNLNDLPEDEKEIGKEILNVIKTK